MRNISSHLSPRLFQLKRGVLRGAIQRPNQLSVSPSKQLSCQLRSFSLRSNLSSLESQSEIIASPSDEVTLDKSETVGEDSGFIETEPTEFQHLLAKFPESSELHLQFKEQMLEFIDALDFETKVSVLNEISRSRFFQDKFCPSAYKAFVVDAFELILKYNLVKHSQNASLILNYLVPAIFKAVEASAAEVYVLAALEQAGLDGDVYEGVLTSLRIDQVPSECTGLATSLLEKMIEQKLRPSSKAFEVVIRRLLGEAKFPTFNETIQKALIIFRQSLTHTGVCDGMLCFQLIDATKSPTRELQIEVISLACAAIEQGVLPPPPVAKKLLRHLCSVSESPSPEIKFRAEDLQAAFNQDIVTILWNSLLRRKELPRDQCFLVLACSYLQIPNRGKVLVEYFLPMLADWKSFMGGKVRYEYLFSVLGLLERENPITKVLHDMKKDHIPISTGCLNALLQFYGKIGNHSNSMTWFRKLTKATKSFGQVAPDSKTYALAYHSAVSTKQYHLSPECYEKALTKDMSLDPLSYSALLDGIVASASASSSQDQRKLLASRLLHIRKGDRVLRHALENGYRGSLWALYCGIIKIRAGFLYKVSDSDSAWDFYQELIYVFDSLFRAQNLQADGSTYYSIFRAISKLTFPQRKIPYVIKDLDDLYRYMVASGTQIRPIAYMHLFTALGSLNKPQLGRRYYNDLFDYVRSGTFESLDHVAVNAAFKAYFALDFLPYQELKKLGSSMRTKKFQPNPETMLVVLNTHVSHWAPLEDLKNVLFLFCKIFVKAVKERVSFSKQVNTSLLTRISDIFLDAGGPAEVSLALDYVIRHTLTPDEFYALSPELFDHTIKNILSSPTRQNLDLALEWLEKMKDLSSKDRSASMLSLIQKVEDLFPQILPTSDQKSALETLKALAGREPPKE